MARIHYQGDHHRTPPSTAVDARQTMYYLPDGTSPTVTHDIRFGHGHALFGSRCTMSALMCQWWRNLRQTTPTTMTKETPSETKARVDQTIQALVVPHSTNMSLESSGPRHHTRYHVVPPMHHTMGAAAGVKVQDMQW